MNINWTKFWTEQLPFCFRKERILALIAALCAIIARLWNDWTTWGERARQRAAYTWQVFWLERLVWLEMGVVIIIEPADGRPFDFVVNVSRITDAETYDESRLRGLIDRYKLAGKSYRIVDSAIVREVRFTDHFCELTLLQHAVKFINYVCEIGPYANEVSFTNHVCEKEYRIEENGIWAEPYPIDEYNTEIRCFASKPVASRIEIVVNCGYLRDVTVWINIGETFGSANRNEVLGIAEVIRISPSQDDTYIYTF